MRRAATIIDVAQRAGVSTGLVSRVINNSGHVSEEKRLRVRQAIEELEYVPKIAAQRLKRKESRAIALILPNLAATIQNQVAIAVQNHARQRGYEASIHLLGKGADENYDWGTLYQQDYEGFIVFYQANNRSFVEAIVRRRMPVVLIQQDMVSGPAETIGAASAIDTVSCGLEGSIYRGTRHLLELGHKRVGILMSQKPELSLNLRIELYKRAHYDMGVALDDDLIAQGVSSVASFGIVNRMLGLPDPPTAIIANGPMLTVGALHAVESRGLQIPDDISLIGSADENIFGPRAPHFATVRFPAEDIASSALDLLQQRIREGPARPRRWLVVDSAFVEGPSIAPPRSPVSVS